MAGRDRYYIKVPVPGQGDAYDYVVVDPRRLDRSVLSTFFELVVMPRGGSRHYRPAFGVEAIVKETLDVTELVRRLKDLVEECEAALEPSGEAGKRVFAQVLQPLQLLALIEALARSDLNAARDALEASLYALMAGTTDIASALARLEQTVSGMQVAHERVSQTLVESGGITDALYLDWAEAADSVIRRVDALDTIERDLRKKLFAVEHAAAGWTGLTSLENAVLARTLQFLSGDGRTFLVTAFNYLESGEDRAALGESISEARSLIAETRAHTVRAERGWAEQEGILARSVLSRHAEVMRLVGDLEEATAAFRRFQRRFSVESALPYEVRAGALITETEYRHAEDLLKDARWAPAVARERITGLIVSASALLGGRPGLPNELAEAIEQAEEYIRRIEEKGTVGMAQSTPVEVQEKPAPTVSNAETERINPARVDELYELVVCVGYVITCKRPFFAASTIPAMLAVLPFLGRATEEEVLRLRNAVGERSHRTGERERAEGKSVLTRWAESDARWIVYRAGGAVQGKLKLTQKAGVATAGLLQKHNLTAEAIRAAHARRREVQQERYLERVGRSSTGQDS